MLHLSEEGRCPPSPGYTPRVRILVTGGTGFAGRHVVPALADAGHQVRVLSRSVRKPELPDGVEFTPGDVLEPTDLRRALEGMDACLHLVAILVERGRQTFYRVNQRGTADVARACSDMGVRRLVHQSALGVHEGLEPFPYLHSKWLGEKAVRDSRLDWTILRPGVLHGEGARFFRPIVWNLRWLPVYPLVNRGRTRFQPLWIHDLARCIAACFAGTGVGQTIEIGGPEILSFRQISEIVARALGKSRRMIDAPLAGARLFAAIQERRRDPLVTNQQLSMVVLDNVTDTDSVKSAFGFQPARMTDTDLRWLARL